MCQKQLFKYLKCCMLGGHKFKPMDNHPVYNPISHNFVEYYKCTKCGKIHQITYLI